MCLAVPGKIIFINQDSKELRMAKVDFAGVKKDICLEWLPDSKVGDYVLVHVGFALNKIDEEDAIETLRILREMGDLPEEKNEAL
ncbi:MAG: HypC/HybG/HupF family hydrogenase formation chaperone [Bacteroidetes bacterium]|nr:HypC/HybG/HupF family hydrogenase formation chaperone [Bacteroidota bacterium]MBU1680482.1 HypC/HybG/HupF family hydrogenase formation chaperone [Bacteroidota bacterium]MBU2507960.1 HypC/HybG/HupF family hydrogenase formation chaperone [Bacteroidota bacterium]